MNTVTLTAVLGVIAPLFIAFLNQEHWSAQVKQIVAVVAAGLIGLIVALTSGVALTFDNVAALITIAIGASQAAYTFLWKPTKVAPVIEANTGIPGATVNTAAPVADDDAPDTHVLAGATLPDPTLADTDENDAPPDPTVF